MATLEELQAKLAALEAENAALKAKTVKGEGYEVTVGGKTYNLALKVSAKSHGLSVYGLGRFPVTLFSPQWRAVLAVADKITAFLDSHAAELSQAKGDTVEAAS